MPMNDQGMNGALQRRIEELELRVKNLETVPQANNTTVQDGAFAALDSTGRTRVELGEFADPFNPGGVTYGIAVGDSVGNTVFLVDDVGMTLPVMPLPTRQVNNSFVAVSSGTFTSVWETSVSYVQSDSVRWYSQVVTDAATTGEARLVCNVAGSPVTSTISLPAGAQTSVLFNWQIPGLLIASGGVLVQLQVRRTSGAGNVNAYNADICYITNHALIGATATGL